MEVVVNNNNFPSDVLKWMKQNVKPQMALKLMQICKYFQYTKFPFFVIKNLHGDYYGWEYQTLSESKFQKTDLKSLPQNLWILGDLNILSKNDQICLLIPKIAVCDIRKLYLIDQNITLEEFKVLSSEKSIQLISLNKSFINYSNGNAVPLENIFDYLPNVKSFGIFFTANSFVSWQNATKKVSPKLKEFRFCQIRTDFNVEECLNFVLNNPQIYFILEISYSRPVEYLQTFTDKIIETWPTKHKLPLINFEGQTNKSKKEMERLSKFYNSA